jgi:hypothetical protein
MDPITIITGIAGLIGKAVTFLKDKKVSDDCFIRAYYLEVSKNIEILKLVDIKNENVNSPAFKSLINSLETGVGAALLCSNEKDRSRIFKILGQGLEIKSPQDKSFELETDDEKSVTVLNINILKAVWFTVQKIDLLKSLTAIEGDIFNQKFRLNVRVANILERFKHIQQKLYENEAMGIIK